MERKFDFILRDDKGFFRDVFRYYPRRTHVHGFHEEPPKLWKDVYKVYCSWAILRQYYDEKTDNKIESSQVLFELDCDECSEIPNLSGIIKQVIETGETFERLTMGQPAGDWCIKQRKGRYSWNDKDKEYEYYDFQVFNNWTNQGYRFSLDKDEVVKFCEWLDSINQYALEHSEGI